MPRINVEDDLFSDPRFDHLCDLFGDREKALGALVFFWRAAQRYWVRNGQKKGIPLEVFERRDGWALLLKASFAKKIGDEIYAKGGRKNFAWILSRKEAGKAGGKKSADLRASKSKQTQANASKSNPLTLTLPLSQNTSTLTGTRRQDAKSDPVRREKDPVEIFITCWNDHRGNLRACKAVNESRKRKIKIRLKENPDIAYWITCIKKLAASEFANSGSWATIDWLIANDNNHVKTFEGNYDNGTRAASSRPIDDPAERNRIFAEQAKEQIAKIERRNQQRPV